MQHKKRCASLVYSAEHNKQQTDENTVCSSNSNYWLEQWNWVLAHIWTLKSVVGSAEHEAKICSAES